MLRKMQSQSSYMLWNAFNEEKGAPYSKAFISRMMVPMFEVLLSKVYESVEGNLTKLKYLQFNTHDDNICTVLNFLGFWKDYGHEKFVKFASSLRFEILRETNRCYDTNREDYDEMEARFRMLKLRIVYDD